MERVESLNSIILKLGGKDGLYNYFEKKDVILPKKDSISLETLVAWFMKEDVMNYRN